MKNLTVEEQIYLCKYHDVDKYWANDHGYTQVEIDELINKYKQNGLYEQYRNMDEFEYEKVCKQEKNKDKYQKILDKYKFDKTRSTYTRMLNFLRECKNIKLAEELNMNSISRRIATSQGIEPYIINNDCKRAIESAYMNNQSLFEMHGYEKKPTLKEFIIKELNLEKSIESVIYNITEAEEVNKAEVVENNIKVEKTQIEKITLDSKIEITLKELLNYYYLKGFADAIEGNEVLK